MDTISALVAQAQTTNFATFHPGLLWDSADTAIGSRTILTHETCIRIEAPPLQIKLNRAARRAAKRARCFPEIEARNRPPEHALSDCSAEEKLPCGTVASDAACILGISSEALAPTSDLEAPTLTALVSIEPEGSRTKRRPKRKPRDRREKKQSKEIASDQYAECEEGWLHARRIGYELNVKVTIRRADIDMHEPDERRAIYGRYRNKLQQLARDSGFPFVCVWSRESERGTGRGEHMHALMHVPAEHQEQFRDVVGRWGTGPEIRIVRADYRVRHLRDGKLTSASAYVLKNAPWRVRSAGQVAFQLGGPIWGKRCGVTRNINARAIARWRAAGLNYAGAGMIQDLPGVVA